MRAKFGTRVCRSIVGGVLMAGLLLGAWPNTADAQSGGAFDLTWSDVSTGGAIATGGAYTMALTLGQCDASVAGDVIGGLYTLESGFLQDATVFPVPVGLAGFTVE